MVKQATPPPVHDFEYYRAAHRRFQRVAEEYRRQRNDARFTVQAQEQWSTALQRSWRHERLERIVWQNRARETCGIISNLINIIAAHRADDNNTDSRDVQESDSEDDVNRNVNVNIPVNINFSNIRLNF